jgi:hypothetical protein
MERPERIEEEDEWLSVPGPEEARKMGRSVAVLC